ncbi:C39 family peptidase [Sporolactobacillus laevolacticus]|uniref:Peptidase C39 n=1 Tax=Sporolactobacillus laevolacticus DSM 442 TaxID=1395513 RepID=V6J1Q1_9BACL|nr:C39 family peptidase [Sporolactobacillus laevolacticus]EST10669.1 peptidase C39 [Sporolactobacillus laevolacticus DSM 442]
MRSFRKHWLGWFLLVDIMLAVLLFIVYSPDNRFIGKKWVADVFNDAEQVKNEALQLADQPSSKRAVQIDAPEIQQKPELPRGCEVTSLAMLLQKAGLHIGKMELARKIDKVPYYQNQLFGNPNAGFVGSMDDISKQGFGVYHEPLAKLGRQYLPSRIIDLTGRSFDSVIAQLQDGIPVVVITNVTFKPLPQNAFHLWHTNEGKIKVTNQEHAVLVTGYDKNHIVFNDPLGKKNETADRKAFIDAWQQMGSQAISYRKSPIF